MVDDSGAFCSRVSQSVSQSVSQLSSANYLLTGDGADLSERGTVGGDRQSFILHTRLISWEKNMGIHPPSCMMTAILGWVMPGLGPLTCHVLGERQEA